MKIRGSQDDGFDSGGPAARGPTFQPWLIGLALLPLLLVLGLCYWWFVQRVEVASGELLVVVNKWGKPLPAEARFETVLSPALLQRLGEPADSRKFAGVLYEARAEGRYFFDPILYDRIILPAFFIEQNELGVVIRKYGEPLPPGKVVATEPHERGPLADVLRQGRHNLNPYAYEVLKVKPIFIPEGHVGVETLRAGTPPANPNRYVVDTGEQGVQPGVLPPGMYFKNPFVSKIDIVDARSHTLDLRAGEAISFPSNDSFEILLEGTVEYAIRQDMAPYVLVAIGDHDDIKTKLILPFTRSLARIEGSKLQARDFISGEARTAFQKRVFEGLSEQAYAQGIEIRAALIRRIEPPAEIAGPISERQVADQQVRQYENEIRVANSQALLVEQQELQKQNQEIGKVNRQVVTITVEAEQQKSVALTEASQRLEVAKLALQTAEETAAAKVDRGAADAEIIRLKYEAEAQPLAEAVSAFGDGSAYAQFHFYERLAPAVKSVLASTDGPFVEVFRQLTERHSVRPTPAADRAAAAQPR